MARRQYLTVSILLLGAAACQQWVPSLSGKPDEAPACTTAVKSAEAWINRQPTVDEAPARQLVVTVELDTPAALELVPENAAPGSMELVLVLEAALLEAEQRRLVLRLPEPRPLPSGIDIRCAGTSVAHIPEILTVY